MSENSTSPLFHVLAKPTGAICNLDCSYCFYLDKEALYPGSDFRIGESVLDAYLQQIFQVHAGQPVVPVAWQGGEPTLMGLPFFERVVEKLAGLARPGQTIEHTLQTNGVRLDADWARFLAKHQVLVGLSIDGPRDLHDTYRRDKGGRGTFQQVARAGRLLHHHGVKVNALVTVHAANQDHPVDVYRFLRDEMDFRFIQLIPIVERLDPDGLAQGGLASFAREGAPVSKRTVQPEAFGRFLCAIFDEWVHHDVGKVFIPTFEAALAAWLSMAPSMCIFRETCGAALALEHNGDLYACDHFVTPRHRLGNIVQTHMRELVALPQQQAFGRNKRGALPAQCQACSVRFACNGGCPKNRLLADGSGQPGLNWLCAGYLAFFSHIDGPMRIMARLLAEQHPAEEIMEILAEIQATRANPARAAAARNEPCPCRSGRKFKRCHGE